LSNPSKFTVLMPTHGKSGIISMSIQSWLDQSFGDFEFLIVGDGCDDQTVAEVEAFNDPRIKFQRYDKGQGSGYDNRNKVLRAARGSYIAYAQHDDLVSHDHLMLLNGALSDPEVVFAHTRPLYVSEGGVICPLFFDLKIPAIWKRFSEVGNLIHTGCIAHPRHVFDTLGFFDANAHPSDYDFWRRMINHFSRSAFKTITTPSVLHFQSRKEGVLIKGVQVWGLPEARALMQMGATWKDYPEGLIWPVEKDTSPQASFHAVLQETGSATFWRNVRQDTDALRDLFAWDLSSLFLRKSLAYDSGPNPPARTKLSILATIIRHLARLQKMFFRILKWLVP
jgi:glycosyltransferase involved in cell wall biosynthesis